MRASRLTLAIALILPTSAATIVVPGGYETQPGAAGNVFPFSEENFRYQQILPSSQFSGPLIFNAIAFRPNPQFTVNSQAMVQVQIDLSVTATTPETMSTTYAANQGSTVTTVFSAATLLQLSGTVNLDGTTPFDINFPFLSNFSYDPSLGNLLLDITIGTSPNAANLPGMDIFNSSAVGFVPTRVYGDSSLTAGATDNVELIVRFSTAGQASPPTSGIPEPSTILLSAAALAALAAWKGQR